RPPPDLLSFPTRRSSDLLAGPQFGQKVSSTIELFHLDEDGTDVAQRVGVRARAWRGAQQVAKLSCPRIGPIVGPAVPDFHDIDRDRKSTRLNSSHQIISY